MCGFCGQAAFQPGNFSAASSGNPFAANGEAFNTRTGDNNIDGVLIGTRWNSNSLTFSFPSSSTYYTQPYEVYLDAGGNPVIDNGYVNNFSPFNASYQAAARIIFQSYANVTNVAFTEVGSTTQADFALAMSTTPGLPTADARFPGYTANEGHQWYNPNNYEAAAVIGSYTWVTIIHETGHAMGLAHGHSPDSITNVPGVAMNANRDSMEFSVMTYRGYIGADPAGGYQNEQYGYAQTLMMYDIAALQFLYGADYTTNSGATTYTFSATTGQMFINGVDQGTPGANRIFRTIWDGGGVDTYDLSNYITNLDIDLTPGSWSVFSAAQLANLGAGNFARANLFNALLFNEDARSLIENAAGGTGNDTIEGNRAANVLSGNNGDDTLIGAGGGDTLFGGAGTDILYGDAFEGSAGIGFGSGLHVHANAYDSTATAFNFSNLFSLASNANIGSSTSIPHVTLRYSDGAAGQNQFYVVTVTAGSVITLDIDGASFDTIVRLFDSTGLLLISNDDNASDTGSVNTTDSFLTYTVGTTGAFYIEVDAYNVTGLPAGTYDLHVSVAPGTSVRGDDGVAGDDILYGGAGADQLFGGLGSDNLFGGLGADVVNGGDGFDLARYDQSTTGIYARLDGITGFSGEAAGDTFVSIEGLVGSGFDDIFVGNGSNGDYLAGLAGADYLYGLGGADSLDGGAGNDNLFGGVGGDQIVGGDGFDLARYDSASSGVYVRLDGVTGLSGEAAGDTFFSIEGLVGSAFGDIMVGSANADYLFGLGGDDYLYGIGGADNLDGGTGNDNLFGGDGADVLNGGDGFDLARYDGASSGVYVRLDGINGFSGEAAGDTFSSIEGLVGSAFGDIIVGSGGADYLFGLGGDDYLYGIGGADNLDGGTGNDNLFGGDGGDVLNGGDGFDLARYDSASAAVYARLDGVAGQAGEAVGDSFVSIEGLVGSAFNDTFVGNNVNGDSLFGLGGNDGLYGLGGADYLDGGLGNDTLAGGTGADQFVFSTTLNAATNVDSITDFSAGIDDIVLSRAVFSGIGTGLDGFEFQLGTGANDGGDRIIYNSATGQLFFDADGLGGAAQTLFATVTAGTALTISDFVMVA